MSREEQCNNLFHGIYLLIHLLLYLMLICFILALTSKSVDGHYDGARFFAERVSRRVT